MELRPAPARWFETVVLKVEAHDAMEALARSGGVQFEWTGAEGATNTLEPLREATGRYRALAAEFAQFWPPPVFELRCCTLPVEVAAAAAIGQIDRWMTAVQPDLERIDRIRQELGEVESWRPVLDSLADLDLDLDLSSLADAGPVLAGYCLILPAGTSPPGWLDGLHAEVGLEDCRALLGVAPGEVFERLRDEAHALGGSCLAIPRWFASSPSACRAALTDHLTHLERKIIDLERKLRTVAEAFGVDQARGVLERVEWFNNTAQRIHCKGQYCWITGWTDSSDPERMTQALIRAGVDAGVSFVEPPLDAVSPSLMRNPRWMEPFEVFTRAVGVPGLKEADPTTWVALMAPLLFGYMCGDVGHGAVIILAGLLLKGRTPLWPLLIFCGLSSIGFGFLYGDVFGYQHLIEPLWLHPLAQPLEVLFVPVVGGAVVLTLGVLLHTVQTCWRSEGGSRGVTDIAHLLVYWGLMLAWVDVRIGWLGVLGMTLCLGNRLWTEGFGLSLLAGFGQLVQSTIEMLINTLSFARVGAFALAHAALESAVIGVADGVQSTVAAALIIVVGNLLVIVIEGMVVSIQTTRLIVFEFFARFFEARGRRFSPAPLPPTGKGR